MSEKKDHVYITTTIPYVNADPHIGFAMEIIQADIFARFQKLAGHDVFFNTGTDEHGVKVYRKSLDEKKDTQRYVDEHALKYRGLKDALNLSDVERDGINFNFIRTTDAHHKMATQEFWRRCLKSGDIYKEKYQTKYCVGCELEKTDSELVDGKCTIHPHLQIELIDEENYFFSFSKYEKPLLKFYKACREFVVPRFGVSEIKAFVSRGLEDFSVSRLKSKMPWGVDVPDDPEQVMYVWFDAFINYISAIGWPDNLEKFSTWWPVVQVAGKDMVRQQAAMWQAMLMSAQKSSPKKELTASKQIIIHGFITSAGQKMSKSLGNVINPYDLVKEYGTDAVRYFLAREVNFFEDSDITLERFKESYNVNLANGLGNLVSRIMKMASDNLEHVPEIPEKTIPREFFDFVGNFEINKAADYIWSEISNADEFIQVNQPFKVVKEDKEKGGKMIYDLVVRLYSIARMLNPILPETSAKIKSLVKENKMPEKPLFPRKE